MCSLRSAVHGDFSIEAASVRTTPATLFVGTRNAEVATLSPGDTSQHVLLVATTKLVGGETIPIMGECGSCFPISGKCCEQEARAAAGTTNSAIASPTATSLEYGVMLLK